MDDKYIADLRKDPAASAWLNQFNEEYVNASFAKGKKHLHKTDEYRKDSYRSNNARNRCIFTREKAQGALFYLDDLNRDNDDLRIVPDDEVDDLDNGSDNS